MHRINNRKTRVERILALLIESGVIYFLFFVRALDPLLIVATH